jgi:hypothetical protein
MFRALRGLGHSPPPPGRLLAAALQPAAAAPGLTGTAAATLSLGQCPALSAAGAALKLLLSHAAADRRGADATAITVSGSWHLLP